MTKTTENESVPADDAARDETVEPKLVPVSEAIRYRKRAQAAEEAAGEMQAQLATVEADLKATAARMARVEQEREVDALLMQAEATDLESARLVLQEALKENGTETEAEVAEVVAALRKSKPHLFRANSAATVADAGVMGGAVRVRERQSGMKPVASAAARALTTGRRQDVLRYMRLRRAGV